MPSIILIAWRNCWRNKLRTLVVVAAMAVGLSAALFAVAFTRGMVAQLIDEVVDMEVAHLTVMAGKAPNTTAEDDSPADTSTNDKGGPADNGTYNADDTAGPGSFPTNGSSGNNTFAADDPLGGNTNTPGARPASERHAATYKGIAGADSLALALEGLDGIDHAAPRLVLPAMLSTARATAQLTLHGIDPAAEQGITGLHRRIQPGQGHYFDGQTANPIIIGRRLADDLNAALNTRIVATFRDGQGDVASTLFRVTAIYDFQNSAFERGNAFVLRHELAAWYGNDPGYATEVALRIDGGLKQTNAMQQSVMSWLQQHHKQPGAPTPSVETWKTLRPEVAFFYHYTGFISTLILGIILLALGLVVVNTMLMVVNERRTELGVLRALGMKDSRLMAMMAFETLFIMLPGVAVSLLITAGLTTWLGNTGIDLTMFSNDYQSPTHNYQSIISLVTTVYPRYQLTEVVRLSVMVVVTALLASWLPIKSALRIQPAEAVKDMLPPT